MMTARRVAATAAAIVLLTAGCGSRGSGTARTSTTPTSEPAAGPTLLVAGTDGIDLRSDAALTVVLAGEAIATAVPDLDGGLVFTTGQSDAATPAAIETLASPGGDRVVAFSEPAARWVSLEDVAAIDGRPTLVFRVGRTLPNDCEPGTECLWQYQVEHLMIRDLETGRETNLGTIGSFESSAVSFRFGDTRAVVTVSPFGTPYSCVGVLPASAILDAADPDVWIGEQGAWRADVVWLGPGGCDGNHEGCPADSACTLPALATISDDGSRAAIAWSRPATDAGVTPQPLTVAVFDLGAATAEQRWQVSIGDPDQSPTWIDFDGDTAVVGRQRAGERLDPVLVDASGTVRTVDIDGTARIWITASPVP